MAEVVAIKAKIFKRVHYRSLKYCIESSTKVRFNVYVRFN